MTFLTPHFHLEEFVASQTAARKGLDNTPGAEVIAHLRILATSLEKVREALEGLPMHINSGYRSPLVNKAVGGVATSAHVTGYAADFICPDYGTPLQVCRTLMNAGIPMDQLIFEHSWIHWSVAPTLRGEVLTLQGKGYIKGLPA